MDPFQTEPKANQIVDEHGNIVPKNRQEPADGDAEEPVAYDNLAVDFPPDTSEEDKEKYMKEHGLG